MNGNTFEFIFARIFIGYLTEEYFVIHWLAKTKNATILKWTVELRSRHLDADVRWSEGITGRKADYETRASKFSSSLKRA